MRRFIHALFAPWLFPSATLAADLRSLSRKVDRIMATQAEMAAQITALKDQVAKVGTEIAGVQTAVTTLQTRVAELEAIIAAATVTPELQAAFDALKAQVQTVDDAIPDAPTP